MTSSRFAALLKQLTHLVLLPPWEWRDSYTVLAMLDAPIIEESP